MQWSEMCYIFVIHHKSDAFRKLLFQEYTSAVLNKRLYLCIASDLEQFHLSYDSALISPQEVKFPLYAQWTLEWPEILTCRKEFRAGSRGSSRVPLVDGRENKLVVSSALKVFQECNRTICKALPQIPMGPYGISTIIFAHGVQPFVIET